MQRKRATPFTCTALRMALRSCSHAQSVSRRLALEPSSRLSLAHAGRRRPNIDYQSDQILIIRDKHCDI